MNYDKKVTKVSGDNPDAIEFARIKFRLNLLNNAPGVYLIIEILDGFYWRGFLKEEALKKLELVRN